MPRIRIVAIALIILGLFGLAYDRITYTKESHEVQIGSLELAVKEKETIDIPLWFSIGAIALGGLLLVPRRMKPSA